MSKLIISREVNDSAAFEDSREDVICFGFDFGFDFCFFRAFGLLLGLRQIDSTGSISVVHKCTQDNDRCKKHALSAAHTWQPLPHPKSLTDLMNHRPHLFRV
jgi:hypothetical protein